MRSANWNKIMKRTDFSWFRVNARSTREMFPSSSLIRASLISQALSPAKRQAPSPYNNQRVTTLSRSWKMTAISKKILLNRVFVHSAPQLVHSLRNLTYITSPCANHQRLNLKCDRKSQILTIERFQWQIFCPPTRQTSIRLNLTEMALQICLSDAGEAFPFPT